MTIGRKAQYARIAIDLDGEPEPREHPPDQGIPRHQHERDAGKVHEQRIAHAQMFVLVTQHQPERARLQLERPLRNDDARTTDADDRGTVVRRDKDGEVLDLFFAPGTAAAPERPSADHIYKEDAR